MCALMDDVTVEPIDLAARVDDALAVQALAFGLTDDEVAVRRQIVLRHTGYPGVRAFGALSPAGEIIVSILQRGGRPSLKMRVRHWLNPRRPMSNVGDPGISGRCQV